MTIRKLRAGRVPGVTESQYVGERGTIFWNVETGEFRLSDGETPGGSRVGFPVATSTRIGGIKAGPGVLITNDGTVTIDSSGLSFSFGDFFADGNNLSTVGVNEDINIVSNGSGTVNVVGEFNVHKTDGTIEDALSVNPVFSVAGDGQVRVLVPTVESTEGAFALIGNSDSAFVTPVQTGVMFHTTGQTGDANRNYFDSVNNYNVITGRRYNGTPTAPTGVLANDIIVRYGSNGMRDDGSWNTGGVARIEFSALENFTTTGQGAVAKIYATAIGSTTPTEVANFTVANGVSASKFTGNLTGNVTGNVSGSSGSCTGNAATVTNGVYTTGSYSDPSWLTISKSKVSLSNVENTALSTWSGTTNITTVGTLGSLSVTNTVTAGLFSGIHKRSVRDLGTITDGGTVTIDFSSDDIVLFTWANGVTLAYQNYTANRLVKVIAKKATSSGTDSLSLGGLTVGNTSSGTTSISGNADQTYFIELTCTNTTIGSVYAKF